MNLTFTYTQFRIAIHLLVAFVFLSDLLMNQLPVKVYEFLKRNKDTVLGFYYIYLAYEIYNNIVIITPLNTPVGSPRGSFTPSLDIPRGSFSSQ
jgi:hypothetical protein